jgi:hypothetical protein
VELVRQGERVLGGCSISAKSPRWRCRACGQDFGDHQDVFGRLFPGVARPDGAR